MNVSAKRSDVGGISETVSAPKTSKAPASVMFSIIAKDAKGIQAQSSGTLIVQPAAVTGSMPQAPGSLQPLINGPSGATGLSTTEVPATPGQPTAASLEP